MYCKRCGMESSTEDVCEWCKQPMVKEAPEPAAEARPLEKPQPTEVPAQPERKIPDAVRFVVCLGVGVGLAIIAIWILFHFTQRAPSRIHYLPIKGDRDLSQALKAGAIFGAFLGLLLGLLLSLTHSGPFLGLVLGAPLGYVALPEWPYVGTGVGAFIGIVLGLIGRWRYKRPVVV